MPDVNLLQGVDLSHDELLSFISESCTMSKALDEYEGRKSCAITTARRLAQFLGDERIKDKGLNCNYVIARRPDNLPTSDRAIPVAIFSTEPSVARTYLRKWCGDIAGGTLTTICLPAFCLPLCLPVGHPFCLYIWQLTGCLCAYQACACLSIGLVHGSCCCFLALYNSTHSASVLTLSPLRSAFSLGKPQARMQTLFCCCHDFRSTSLTTGRYSVHGLLLLNSVI